MKKLFTLIFVSAVFISSYGQKSVVRIIERNNTYSLELNGKPFNIKGVVGDTYTIGDTLRKYGWTKPYVIAEWGPDKDSLTYKWEIRGEAVYASYAGQGEKVPRVYEGLAHGNGPEVRFDAPQVPGPYRIFAYVYDQHGHFSTANIPFLVSPELMLYQEQGKYSSGTMNLLQKSDPSDPEPVKLLVYGQSISEQDRWLGVKNHVTESFPNAAVNMKNLSIGGFSAQILYKTSDMDVTSFLPDLDLLHVYGGPHYYDSILYTIRSRTAAEVAIMTGHFTGLHTWSDTMSYHILPSLARKYHCEMISIRDSWKQYLEENNLKPSVLLSDGTHMNAYGNLIISELVKQFFRYRPECPADPDGLSKTYVTGKDVSFRKGMLALPFYGNSTVIKPGVSPGKTKGSLHILVDGRAPSEFQGTCNLTRPEAPSGKKWPWTLPAMIRIRHVAPWVNDG